MSAIKLYNVSEQLLALSGAATTFGLYDLANKLDGLSDDVRNGAAEIKRLEADIQERIENDRDMGMERNLAE